MILLYPPPTLYREVCFQAVAESFALLRGKKSFREDIAVHSSARRGPNRSQGFVAVQIDRMVRRESREKETANELAGDCRGRKSPSGWKRVLIV